MADGTQLVTAETSVIKRQRPAASVLSGIGAVLLLMVTTLLHAFGGPSSLYIVVAGAALLLIGAGYQRINRNLRNTSFVLFAAGLLALPFARAPLAALERGMFVAGLLLSLTASVMLIASCALQSQRIHAIGAALRERQGNGRFMAFTLTSEFFSGILGLAGANLMFVMAAPDAESAGANETRTATVVAVARGFTAASCWSPVFGNMAILLALYPSLHWVEVFPVGLAIGQLTVLVGAFMNPRPRPAAGQLSLPATSKAPSEAPTSSWKLLRIALPVLLALVAFLLLILFVSKSLHIVITAAIILLAPCVSLLCNTAMGRPGQRWVDGTRALGRGALRFPALASEAILFVAAGCAGSIMADAFPSAWVMALGHVLNGRPFWGVSFLLFSILAAALVGIHPVLTAVFLASSVTPVALALPPIVHMAAILSGWGLSTSVTPFSVLSLTASRYSGVGLYQISLGKNWMYASLNALIVCVVLTAYVRLG